MISEATPLISVVVPAKNGEFWLSSQLEAFFAQTLAGEAEFIYLDSGSTDNTLKILAAAPVKVIHIPTGEFNHGETRNVGARAARGKYVVMTVQDAKPASNLWLQHLLNGFTDEEVAGVNGQQVVPHELDKNPIEWFRPVSKPGMKRVKLDNPELYNQLNPIEKKMMCSWDNVNAMYRSSVLQKIPFKKTNFGEDAQWAQEVIVNGLAIVYNTEAAVYHYHQEDYDFSFKRTIAVAYNRYMTFGVIPNERSYNNNLKTLVGNAKALIKEPTVCWADKWKWYQYTLTKRRAGRDASIAFNTALRKGKEEVDKLYKSYCEKAPMASRKAVIFK